jgi:hypothetical protein
MGSFLRSFPQKQGNHSAGKSSFINWYIGEGIQKTGGSEVATAIFLITLL